MPYRFGPKTDFTLQTAHPAAQPGAGGIIIYGHPQAYAGAYGPKTDFTMRTAQRAQPVYVLAPNAVGDPQIHSVGDPQIRKFRQLYAVPYGSGIMVMGVPL